MVIQGEVPNRIRSRIEDCSHNIPPLYRGGGGIGFYRAYAQAIVCHLPYKINQVPCFISYFSYQPVVAHPKLGNIQGHCQNNYYRPKTGFQIWLAILGA